MNNQTSAAHFLHHFPLFQGLSPKALERALPRGEFVASRFGNEKSPQTMKIFYSGGMTGTDLTFTAAGSISSADWKAWAGAMTFISMKSPGTGGYLTLDKGSYAISTSGRTITFDGGLFSDAGSYSFIFHAAKYANKSVSVTMKKAAPQVQAVERYVWGGEVALTFGDPEYQKGLSVYVRAEDGSRSLISASCLDRTQAGMVIIRPEYFTLSASALAQPGTYTLELTNNSFSPASQTVTVTLGAGFTDVPPGYWCYADAASIAQWAVDPLQWTKANGIINGVTATLMEPNGTATRAQVTVAYEDGPLPESCQPLRLLIPEAESSKWAYAISRIEFELSEE